MSTPKSKTRTTIKYVAGPEGGPQLCGTCKKKVKYTGAGLAALVIIGFSALVIFVLRETPAFSGLTVPVLWASVILVALVIGISIPFAIKRTRDRENAISDPLTQNTSMVCDGCKNIFR